MHYLDYVLLYIANVKVIPVAKNVSESNVMNGNYILWKEHQAIPTENTILSFKLIAFTVVNIILHAVKRKSTYMSKRVHKRLR